MYANKNTNNKSTQMKAKKPFCKVCKDAGKSEDIYTSHFLRDKLGANSQIICPTLLALECQYCHQKGHTVSYCKKLKENQKFHKRNVYNKEKETQTTSTKKNQSFKNKFAVFDDNSDHSDTEEEVEEEVPVDYTKMSLPQHGVSYAAMASKPQTVYGYENEAAVIPMALEEAPNSPPYPPTHSPPGSPPPAHTYAKIHPIPVQPKMRNWADWESSDDEEEDEYTTRYVDNTAW
jgi:hypothetical protein